MNNIKKMNFFKSIDQFNDKEYLLAIIMYTVAPTIKKCKPSYLIIFHDKGKRNLNDLWGKYKLYIKNKIKIDFYELYEDCNSTTVLFYY